MEELFSRESLVTAAEAAEPIHGFSLSQSARLGRNKLKIAQELPVIEKNKCYHLPSMGSWSSFHLLEHVLSITGPARVHLTSWAISEEAVKAILKMLQNGSIKELYCLFDERVKSFSPNAWQIAQSQFAKIYLDKCHAKITIIENDDYQISITGSGNLSVNRRIESYVLTENITIAKFYSEWIQQMISGANPFLNSQKKN